MTAGAASRLAGVYVLAGFLLAAAAATVAAQQIGFHPIELRVSPIAAFSTAAPDTTVGALEFRGGIEVASSDGDFGGLSGLDFAPDGTLFAVSDYGFWLEARPVEEDGRLVGLADARLAPMLDREGKPIASKSRGDAEGLRIVSRNGRLEALVSFEGTNDLRRFVAAPDFAHARPQAMRLPKSLTGVSRNRGLEAVAVAPQSSPFAGAILLLAEHSLDESGNHRGWIVGGPRAGTFSLKRIGEFDVTDAAFLPDGDLLVLERSFSFTTVFGMRLRRIAAADLVPGATVVGKVLAEADMRYQIDNMEGMAVRQAANGETLITIVSDDNRNILQRTILLQFALADDAPPRPRSRPQSDK